MVPPQSGSKRKGGGSQKDISVLVDRIMDSPASDTDIRTVEAQLGRYPRGMVAVGARCVCGNPLAVVTRPLLPDGTPFPTTAYLTSPEAVKAVSQLEASGLMQTLTQELELDQDLSRAYREAHLSYLLFRKALAQRLGDNEDHIQSVSAGGMPTRVKCLHALVGQSLVMGTGINPIGDRVMDMIQSTFDPAVCRCASPWGTDSENQ